MKKASSTGHAHVNGFRRRRVSIKRGLVVSHGTRKKHPTAWHGLGWFRTNPVPTSSVFKKQNQKKKKREIQAKRAREKKGKVDIGIMSHQEDGDMEIMQLQMMQVQIVQLRALAYVVTRSSPNLALAFANYLDVLARECDDALEESMERWNTRTLPESPVRSANSFAEEGRLASVSMEKRT